MTPMAMKRVNNHTYMGMDTEFNKRGEVKLSIIGYIDEDIDEFLKYVTTLVVIPTSENLFRINKSGKGLSEDQDRPSSSIGL